MDDPETASFLAETYGAGRPNELNRVARGAAGAVWRLDVQAGTSRASYAAKEFFWLRPDAEEIAREAEFTQHCRDAGVATPAVIRAVDGGYLARSDATGRWWRLFGWVDGDVPDRRDVPTVCWLAAQLGVIHALGLPPSPGTSSPPFYQRVDADWPALADAAALAGVDWADRLAGMSGRLAELSALVNETGRGEEILTHRDPKATNVLAAPGGRRWLVDWDTSGPLAPWREVGLLLMHHLDQAEALRRIVTSYRLAGGEGQIAGPESFATGLAVWLNYLHGQAGQAIDPTVVPEHRAYAEQKVRGLLTAVPTLDLLECAAAVSRGRRRGTG